MGLQAASLYNGVEQSTPSSNFGRHVFGVAALAVGFITLVWHDYNDWHQLRYLVYATAAALVFGCDSKLD